jgi:hypothetical protein
LSYRPTKGSIAVYYVKTNRRDLRESKRGVSPSFLNLFPLSKSGEGDKGGEVDIHKFDIQL